MKSNIKISVLLPFYNPGKAFASAIQSIINQTYEHFELILVSNKSCEKSNKTAYEFQKADNRIKIVEESSQGIAFALNNGLKVAQGQYIARMDADDFSYPERLEQELDFLEKNANYDVVSCQTEFKSDIQENEGYKLYVEWQNSIITNEEHYLNRFVESPLAHPSVMFRKRLIADYGYYSTEKIPEDYELWLRWMRNGIKFYKLPQVLLKWNDHSNRLSRISENYSIEAFQKIKCMYLADYIKLINTNNKKIVLCGTGKYTKECARLLASYDIKIHAFTDIIDSSNKKIPFIKYTELTSPDKYLIISLIQKRGVRNQIIGFFEKYGFVNGINIIAG